MSKPMPKPLRRTIGNLLRRFLPAIMILCVVGAAFLTEILISGNLPEQPREQNVSAKSAAASRERIKTSTGIIRSGETISSLLGKDVQPKGDPRAGKRSARSFPA